jgi:hypothetical protein
MLAASTDLLPTTLSLLLTPTLIDLTPPTSSALRPPTEVFMAPPTLMVLLAPTASRSSLAMSSLRSWPTLRVASLPIDSAAPL